MIDNIFKRRAMILTKSLAVWLFLPAYRKCFAINSTGNIFKGKRVAIIGPATSAFNTGKGKYIDSFDLIVRMNHGPKLLDLGRGIERDIGSRTDVLFHNVNEDNGKTLDFDMYKKQGVKYIVTYLGHRWASLDYRILNYLSRYRNKHNGKLFIVERALTKSLHKQLNPYSPTTGIITISTILASDFKELYITGITFGTTPYIKGYDFSRESKGIDLKDYLNSSQTHSIAKECVLFKTLIQDKKEKIILDEALKGLIT